MDNPEQTNICRVCLENREEMFSIFDTYFLNEPISNLIMHCASVEIHQGDGLPDFLCTMCRKRLEIAFSFKYQCEMADTKLRQNLYNNDITKHIKSEMVKTENLDRQLNVDLGEASISEINVLNAINETDEISYGDIDSDDPLYPNMYVTTEMRQPVSPDITSQTAMQCVRGEYECPTPYCFKKFNLKSNMIAHVWLHHQYDKTKLSTTVNASHSDSHAKQNSIESINLLEINDQKKRARKCKKSHKTKSELGDNLLCYICKKLFSRENYKLHKKEHSSRIYICDVDHCKKQFSEYLQYAVHRKHEHDIENYLHCPECDLTFKFKKNLENHLLTAHSENISKSSNCTKMSKEKWKIEIHRQKNVENRKTPSDG